MNGTPPDWKDEHDVTGNTVEENQDVLRQSVDGMHMLGAKHLRATVLPADGPANKFIIEGWRERPDRESPVPVR